jgi:hypothetical protein
MRRQILAGFTRVGTTRMEVPILSFCRPDPFGWGAMVVRFLGFGLLLVTLAGPLGAQPGDSTGVAGSIEPAPEGVDSTILPGATSPWKSGILTAPSTRGTWTRLDFADPEPREAPTVIYDSRRKRVVLFGGFDGWSYHAEVWETDPDGKDEWRRMPIRGVAPAGRSQHLAVYDPASDAMIVYGGHGAAGYLGDVWMLDFKHARWSLLTPSPGPRPASRASCIGGLDSQLHRIVVGCGQTNQRTLNDVWAFSLDAQQWTLVRSESRGNLSRSNLALAFDSRRNRWLGFGGIAGDGAHNELWSWDVVRKTGWARMDYADEGPVALVDPCAVYDPVRDQLIVLGGSGSPRNQMELSTIALSEETRGPRLTLPGVSPPNLHGAAAIYDPAHDRVLVFGGRNDYGTFGELWELSLGADMHWTVLTAPTTPGMPGGRAYAASVFDTRHQRWVILGGLIGNSALSDIWTFDVASQTWSRQPFDGPQVFGAAAAYDAKNDRILLFGGSNGTAVNQDTWEVRLDAGTAIHLTYTDDYPLKRTFPSAFYDTTRDEMMLFSGTSEGCIAFGCNSFYDAWAFSTPTPFTVTCTPWTFPDWVPPQNAYGAGVFDPLHHRLVLIGGVYDDRLVRGGFAMDLGDPLPEWRIYSPGLQRSGASGVYDPTQQRMLIFGGDLGAVRTNDLLQLGLEDAPPLEGVATTGSPPLQRFLHAACMDPEGRRMFVFGGDTYRTTNRDMLGDLWELELSGGASWKLLIGSPPFPEQRSAHAALYDAPRDRLIVFGGTAQDDSVWALTLGGKLRWSKLATRGVSPGWRAGPSLLYDSKRDQAIMLGGSRGRAEPLKDAWRLSLADPPAWSPILPRDELPEGGENQSAVYDPRDDAVIDFGGDVTTKFGRFDYPHYRPGAFRLSLENPTWQQLRIQGGPSGNRTNQAAVFDAARDRVVSFGGLDDHTGTMCDTWSIGLDDSTFVYAAMDSCAGLSPFFSPTLVLDPSADRLLLYGGDGRVWMRPLSSPTHWAQVPVSGDVPATRSEHAAVFDSRRHRMLVYGGATGSRPALDLWQFTIEESPPRPRIHNPVGIQLAGVAPSPARGAVVLDFTLPDAEPTRLQVFDLAGRRVVSRDVGALGAGRHQLQLAETERFAPGVYLVRLSRGSEVKTARFVLVP